MPYPNRAFRRHNFQRDADAGIDLQPGKIDAEVSALCHIANELNDFIRQISTPSGALRFSSALREMDLVEETVFTATSGQTAFTVPTYDTGTDRVRAFSNGSLIAPASVTLTNSTTVTLPAQTLGTTVVIEVFSAGSGVLTQLADTANGLGASLVAIEDAGGLFDATDVETALQEGATDLADLITALGTISNYIKKDGSITYTANQPMGSHKLTGLAAGTTNGDSVRYEQLAAVIASLNSATSTFLAKSGGTMTGPINMGSQRITALPAAVTVSTDAISLGQVTSMLAAFAGLPVGTIIAHGSTSAPTGWLACDGSAVSRTTYADLFASIGVTYGVGNGTTTFNVPDIRGRVTIGTGTGSGLTTRAANDTGGEETHVLTETEMPSHDHPIRGSDNDTGDSGSNFITDPGDHWGNASSEDAGGDQAHNNMQPYIAIPHYIRY